MKARFFRRAFVSFVDLILFIVAIICNLELVSLLKACFSVQYSQRNTERQGGFL